MKELLLRPVGAALFLTFAVVGLHQCHEGNALPMWGSVLLMVLGLGLAVDPNTTRDVIGGGWWRLRRLVRAEATSLIYLMLGLMIICVGSAVLAYVMGAPGSWIVGAVILAVICLAAARRLSNVTPLSTESRPFDQRGVL